MILKSKLSKISLSLLVIMLFLMFCGYTSTNKLQKQREIKSKNITLITKVLPYGEATYAIACDFGSKVDSSKLSATSFQIETLVNGKFEKRTITKVYTNDILETSDIPKPGRYVIIELDPNDSNAYTLTYSVEKDQNTRNDLNYYITLKENIKTINGTNYKASEEKILNENEITPIVDDFKNLSYEGSNGNKLNYRLFKPKENLKEKYPLVIFLHGSGERGNDNATQLLSSKGAISFAEPEAQEKNPCYVLAPQSPYNENPSSYWCDEPTNTLLFDLIKETSKKYNIDANRIYITGLSNGGDGVWNLIEKYPKFFAAAVPICGVTNPNYDVTDYPCYAPIIQSNIQALKSIPIWVFHAADDPAVNVKNSREIVTAIKEVGGNLINYTEYPEGMIKPVAHFAWVKAYEDKDLVNWLFKQSNTRNS